MSSNGAGGAAAAASSSSSRSHASKGGSGDAKRRSSHGGGHGSSGHSSGRDKKPAAAAAAGGGDDNKRGKKRKPSSDKGDKSGGKKASKSASLLPPEPQMKKQKSKFKCELEFRNALPEPPLGPKLLAFPSNSARLSEYAATQLDVNFKFDIPTDRLIGMPMDLVDTDQYVRPANVKKGELAPADAALFPEGLLGSGGGSGSGAVATGRVGLSRSGVPSAPKLESLLAGHTFSWLRRVEYLSNNLYDAVGKQYSEHNRRADEALKVAESKEKTDRDKQIKIVESTFRLAKDRPVHPTKPHLRPLRTFELFPDDDLPKADHTLVHVLHDLEHEIALSLKAKAAAIAKAAAAAAVAGATPDAPASAASSAAEALAAAEAAAAAAHGPNADESRELARNALLRTYTDVEPVTGRGNLFHGVYVPSGKALPPGDGSVAAGAGADGFEWTREFVRNPAPPVKQSDNYFLLFDTSDAATTLRYSRYQHRLHIRKRVVTDQGTPVSQRPAYLAVHHQPFAVTVATKPADTPAPAPAAAASSSSSSAAAPAPAAARAQSPPPAAAAATAAADSAPSAAAAPAAAVVAPAAAAPTAASA